MQGGLISPSRQIAVSTRFDSLAAYSYFQEGGRGNQEMKEWERRNEELPRREP